MVAGKGRSGTIAVSYLVAYDSWPPEKALNHFTTQRMRYGEGVSIPSQRRWVRYVELWSNKLAKKHVQGQAEILRIQFWGMKVCDGNDNIEVGIAGFVDGLYPSTKVVEQIYLFDNSEAHSFDIAINDRESLMAMEWHILRRLQFG
jgi:protein-tyrosine phosphatase